MTSPILLIFCMQVGLAKLCMITNFFGPRTYNLAILGI